MKRNFKKRFMTGVAAIVLVAPLVLGGLNSNVHAANTSSAAYEENMIHNGSLKKGALGASNPAASGSKSNPNAGANAGNDFTANNSNSNQSSGNSSQLAAIKAQIQTQEGILQSNLTQAQNQYKKLPKAQQKAQLKTLDAKLQKQQKPIQQKITALQKKYNQTMTPAQRKQAQEKQKAAQQKVMKQIQAQMKAQQKKEQKQMLKTAQTIFVTQGNKVYTLRTDVTKNKQGQEQLNPIPGINKKYYSTKKAFAKKQLKEVRRAQTMALSAKKLHGKTARKNAMKKANNLFMQYARVANMPTKKQQQAEEKKAAKQQKKSQRKNRSRKTNRKAKAKTRKNTKRKHAKRTHRSNTVRKNQRQSRTFKKNGVTVLRSEYRRGNNRKAKAAGFVNGYAYPDGIHTIFNRYQPNSKRAVLPKNLHIYKVNPKHITKNGNATAWLVGRRTNSEKKISNMKQAYYYNTGYHGWLNIGKPSQLKK